MDTDTGEFTLSHTVTTLRGNVFSSTFDVTPNVNPTAEVTLTGSGITGASYVTPTWAIDDIGKKQVTVVLPNDAADGLHTATFTAAGGNYDGETFTVNIIKQPAVAPPPLVPVVVPPPTAEFVPAPTIQLITGRQETFRDIRPDLLINPANLSILRGEQGTLTMTLVTMPVAQGVGVLDITTSNTGITVAPNRIFWTTSDVVIGDPVRRIAVSVSNDVPVGSYTLTFTGLSRFVNVQPFNINVTVPTAVAAAPTTRTSVREQADSEARNMGDWVFPNEGDYIRGKQGIYAGQALLTDNSDLVGQVLPLSGNYGDLRRTYDGPMTVGGSVAPIFIDAYYNGQPLDGNSLSSFFEFKISNTLDSLPGEIEWQLRRRFRSDLKQANRRVANKLYVSTFVYAVAVADEFRIIQYGGNQGRGLDTVQLPDWLERTFENIRYVQGFDPNYRDIMSDTQFVFQTDVNDPLDKAKFRNALNQDIGSIVSNEGMFSVAAYEIRRDGSGRNRRIPTKQVWGVRR